MENIRTNIPNFADFGNDKSKILDEAQRAWGKNVKLFETNVGNKTIANNTFYANTNILAGLIKNGAITSSDLAKFVEDVGAGKGMLNSRYIQSTLKTEQKAFVAFAPDVSACVTDVKAHIAKVELKKPDESPLDKLYSLQSRLHTGTTKDEVLDFMSQWTKEEMNEINKNNYGSKEFYHVFKKVTGHTFFEAEQAIEAGTIKAEVAKWKKEG